MAAVVVIGAGLAGLATALFAARRGHDVTVLERDDRPPSGVPEEDFLHWQRPGVPHARHGHLFLARSTRILHEEAPDVVDALRDRGAVEDPVFGDPGPGVFMARRLVYEAVLRRAVERESGVTLLAGVPARGLRFRPGPGGGPVAVAVRTGTGDDVGADLIVDSAATGSLTMRSISTLGRRPPVAQAYKCTFLYFSRHYRVRRGLTFPVFELPVVATLGYATVILFPADNGVFSISIVLSVDDPFRDGCRDGESFDRVLRAVPLTSAWLEAGEPIDDPQPMGGFVDAWQRLVDAHGPLVGGVLLVGDAAMRTSPVLGRGVTLAFTQAQRVAMIAERAGPTPVQIVGEFDEWMETAIAPWFASQLAEDRALDARLQAALCGDTVERPDDVFQQVVTAFGALRASDSLIRQAADRTFNLLVDPAEILRDRRVLRRVNEYRAQQQGAANRSGGPCRAEFEWLIGRLPKAPSQRRHGPAGAEQR